MSAWRLLSYAHADRAEEDYLTDFASNLRAELPPEERRKTALLYDEPRAL